MSRVLCVRAGGLGDVLLLRQAVATLRAGGHSVWLLAPERHASALLGSDGVERVIDWESVGVASLLAGRSSSLAKSIRTCAAAIVYSASTEVARGIAALVPNTICHGPVPLAAEHAATWYTRPALALAPLAVDPPTCQATPDPSN